MWNYPGNGCWFRDYHMRFHVACLSISSVATFCLEDLQIGNDPIYPELLPMVEMVRWIKLPGYWQLWTKSTLRQKLTIIYWNVQV